MKYVTLFLTNFEPPLSPDTLCHTSRDPLQVRHTSRTPRFLVGLVLKTRTKAPCTNCLNCLRGFLPEGFCKESFVWKDLSGWFLSVQPYVRIHLLQQKVKHHFKFQVL